MSTHRNSTSVARAALALAAAAALAAGGGCGKRLKVNDPTPGAHGGPGSGGGGGDGGAGGGPGGGGGGGGGGSGNPNCGPGVGGPPVPFVRDPDVYLLARTYEIPANTFGNAAPITMWGFVATDPSFTPLPGAIPSSPGPTIYAAAGTQLRIHVRNDLTGPLTEPVSVVVPGQTMTMTPVWFDPATGATTALGARAPGDVTSRVRSFAAETPPDHTSVVTYTIPNLKAGTYLYQSGTHPAVQVQMGLFGELVVFAVPDGNWQLAYDDLSSWFDWSVSLVLSEIDPELHAAIAAGHYGPTPPSPTPADWRTSTIDYRPRFFLVNGTPYTPGTLPLVAGWPRARILLRLLNAGLATKVPVVLGPNLSIIAEDGNFLAVTDSTGASIPAPRQQYSALLPAGKTLDALFTAGEAGTVPVFDRRLNLTNAGAAPGGMLAYLRVFAEAADARAAAGQ